MYDLVIDFIDPNGKPTTWVYHGVKTLDSACHIAETISDVPDITELTYAVHYTNKSK